MHMLQILNSYFLPQVVCLTTTRWGHHTLLQVTRVKVIRGFRFSDPASLILHLLSSSGYQGLVSEGVKLL